MVIKNGLKTRIGVLIIVIIIAIVSVSFVAITQLKRTKKISQNGMIFFYGTTCPHCRTVENYMQKNSVPKKTPLKMVELFQHRSNIPAYLKIAKKCNLRTDIISVPMLWTGKYCLEGPNRIINFLNTAGA